MKKMMMMKNLMTKVAVAALSTSFAVGCGDVVIKVNKKPREVDLKSIENQHALNLTNTEDFLKHLDDLRVVAIDLLIKKYKEDNWRGKLRSEIRKYRKFMMAKAENGVNLGDSFYAKAEECKTDGSNKSLLNFNVEQMNDVLGQTMQLAILAKISEGANQLQAVKLNSLNAKLDKEMQAAVQLAMMELGLKIEGKTDVEDKDGKKILSGDLTIAIISDDTESEEIKASDLNEVLHMSFVRALGEDNMGTFEAKVEIAKKVESGLEASHSAVINVDRKMVESKLLHTAHFEMGKVGQAPAYSRTVTFEQVDGDANKIKITDVIHPGTDKERVYATVLDTKKFSWCKISMDKIDQVQGEPGLGDENPFDPTYSEEPSTTDEPKAEQPTVEEPKKDVVVVEEKGSEQPSNNDDDQKVEETKKDTEIVNPNKGGTTPTPTQQTPGQKGYQTPTQK